MDRLTLKNIDNYAGRNAGKHDCWEHPVNPSIVVQRSRPTGGVVPPKSHLREIRGNATVRARRECWSHGASFLDPHSCDLTRVEATSMMAIRSGGSPSAYRSRTTSLTKSESQGPVSIDDLDIAPTNGVSNNGVDDDDAFIAIADPRPDEKDVNQHFDDGGDQKSAYFIDSSALQKTGPEKESSQKSCNAAEPIVSPCSESFDVRHNPILSQSSVTLMPTFSHVSQISHLSDMSQGQLESTQLRRLIP